MLTFREREFNGSMAELEPEGNVRDKWVPSDSDMSKLINAAIMGGDRSYGEVGASMLRMYDEYLTRSKKDDSEAGYGRFVGYVIGRAICEWVRQPDEKGNTRFDAESLARGAASLWYKVGPQNSGEPVENGPWKEAPDLVIQKLVTTYFVRSYKPGEALVNEFLEWTAVNVLIGLRDEPIANFARVANNLTKVSDDRIRESALGFLRRIEVE